MTFRSPLLHLGMVVLLCSLAYSNTFSVPFHFDDKLNIADNAHVKDLGNFWPPGGNRWIGYLTFALNYRLNGLDTTGYHAVNLVIHILASLLVYWLVLLTFGTPYCAASPDPALAALRTRKHVVALLAALLFACHPVQTQAVTYIVQRFASLAALLYLLSLAAYIRARLFINAPGAFIKQASLYSLSLVAAVLAMMTKENAYTLPAVVVLYELCFLRVPREDTPGKSPQGRFTALLPFALVLPAIALLLVGFPHSAFVGTYDISRTDYLLTQFRVIVIYVQLLFLPLGQSIDYDIPVYHGFFEPAVFGSFLFLSAVAAAAAFLLARSRKTRGPSRLIAFGLLWFFATLSVESSIIPLPDVIFEHRLYLPSVGVFLALAASGVWAWHRAAGSNAHPLAGVFVAAAGVVLILALTAVTFARNMAWSSEIGLWEDAVAKYPASHRAHTMLGGLYRSAGRREEAKRRFLRSLAIKPAYSEARVNLGSILVEEGRLDEAMQEFMIAVRLKNMDEIDTALLLVNIGNVYRLKNLVDKEIEYYTYALGLVPGDGSIHFRLAAAYQAKGMHDRAREHFGRARKLDPDRY